MKPRKCIYYMPEQKTIILDKYKQGDSLHEITKMFDRYHPSIMLTIYQTGATSPYLNVSFGIKMNLILSKFLKVFDFCLQNMRYYNIFLTM